MEEKRSQDITEALSGIVNELSGKFDMQELLPQIINTVMYILQAEVCSIFLKKKDAPNKIKCVAGSGFAEKIIDEAEYEMSRNDGLTGYIAETGDSVNIKSIDELLNHPYRKGKYDHIQYEDKNIKCRNLLAYALKIKGEIFGVIKVENKKYNSCFSGEDQMVFEMIANVIALAIQNARLHESREEQVQAIRKIISSVVGKKERHILLDEILQTTMHTLKANVCSIFLKKEDDPESIECVAATGYAKSLLSIPELGGKPAYYKIGEGFTGMVAEGRNESAGYNITSVAEMEMLTKKEEIKWVKKWNHVQWAEGNEEFRNLLAYPLKIKDEIFGVIKVENKRDGKYFSEKDFQMFKTVANVVALIIENFNLLEQTKISLETITAMAAHKINNHIANYSGIERRLRKDEKIDEKILQRIHETTESLKKLVREFNNFSKPFHINRILGDINQLIENQIDTALSDYKDYYITIKPILDKNIQQFSFDSRISESIYELIKNSVKAITRDGKKYGNIIVSTQLENFSEKNKLTKIVIEDDGPGLPGDTDIFKPYISTYPDGTGLGLATVKKMVQAHGGDIKILSKEKGACFEITLPIDQK